MAIDSVNNNRTATVTGAALAVGAGAGAAYGWSSAKILEGNTPKDSFVRTLDKSNIAQKKRALVDEQKVLAKIQETGSLENVSDDIKAKLQKAAGGKSKLDIAKAKADQIKELAKGLVLSDDAKKAELKKLDDSSISVLQKKLAKLKDVPEKATVEDLKKIIRNNHELFDLKKPEKGSIDDAVKEFVKNKELAGLKSQVSSVLANEKNRLTGQIAARKGVVKRLFTSVYDVSANKMKELPKDAKDTVKTAFKTMKNAVRNFKTASAAKWAAVGAGVVGLTSFATAKLMGRPVVIEKECDCPDCED